MHCLANFCYVCLEKKDKLSSDINSSLSVNKDIMHIIGYLPCNLAWLKTLQIILICEECCSRLRQNYQFMEKCSKNSAQLQSYMNKLITTSISDTGNAVDLVVKLNISEKDIDEEKCEIQSQDEAICTFLWRPSIKQEVVDQSDNNSTGITEETEDVFVNTEDYFVKEENTWKQEETDDGEEYPTDNQSTENVENKSDSEIALNVSSGFTLHTTNASDINTATPALNIHTRMDIDGKSYECAICNVRMKQKGNLVIHMRRHTGEKPYNCVRCNKCFAHSVTLKFHMRTHTGETPYSCPTCDKSFVRKYSLQCHMRIYTGEKPYSCLRCKKCFTVPSTLANHMKLVHTVDKPYNCSTCDKCFAAKSILQCHMRIHTGEKPYSCLRCNKYFTGRATLANHMRLVHSGDKPYNCSTCNKSFALNLSLVRHMKVHTGK